MYLYDGYFKANMNDLEYEEYIKIKYHHKVATNVFSQKCAKIVKKWAKEKNAKYYAHWFFPLDNQIAQKFVQLDYNLSGEELVCSQSDASSFITCGGVKTHKACGYAKWDISGKVFIQDVGFGKTLYLPSFFCDYSGNALDYKIPLERSYRALNASALNLLKLLGEHSKWIVSNIGIEQEFFLLKKSEISDKLDLCKLGCRFMEDDCIIRQNFYYSSLPARAAEIIKEVKEELDKIGISVSLFHSEVSPGQYEIVPKYEDCPISLQDNVFLMETLKNIADKHNMVAIFNEKPQQNINGSGKHNNWSIVSFDGCNLFDPLGRDYKVFLSFFCAVLCATNKHYNLLMSSITTVNNSFRLGGNEAPQSAFSVYVGDNLYKSINNYIQTGKWQLIAPKTINKYPIKMKSDICNRNRTSTFAFTGNKFEFRAVGSSQNSMLMNTFLNSVVAEQLNRIAEELKKTKNIDQVLIPRLKQCQNIIYNGNCYSKKWRKLARERDIKDYKNNPDIYDEILSENSKKMFRKLKIYTAKELKTLHYMLKRTYTQQAYNRANVFIKVARQEMMANLNKHLGKLDGINENVNKQRESTLRVINKIEQNLLLIKKCIVYSKENRENAKNCYTQILPTIVKCQRLYQTWRNNLL